MTRLLFPVAALVLCVALSTTAALSNDLDPLMATAMEGTKTPAIAVLVMRDGKIADAAVRGVRRNDGNDPAQPGDLWLIGSDGKPMTATLIARLVDRGALSWDAPLSKMLPELAKKMRPEYRPLTLVQMLSHRTGLAHDISDLKFLASLYNDKRSLTQQRLAYIAKALTEKPEIEPGTAFSYSNTGFLIAAAIAERATGKSYEDLMRSEVFGPLGMTSVGFGPTPAGTVQGHVRDKPVSKPDDSNPLMFAPAGNMHMSMNDWALFCLDQMAGSKGHGKLLSAASYQMMTSRLPGATTALAWGFQDTIAGLKGPVLMHAGSDGNWNALVALFPQTGNGALVATNSADDMGGDKASTALLKAILPSLAPPK